MAGNARLTDLAGCSGGASSSVTVDSQRKRKAEGEDVMEGGAVFLKKLSNMKIEEQIVAVMKEYGWDASFRSNSMDFIGKAVSKMSKLSLKKEAFGDVITGMGMKKSKVLQMLVDVQDIIDTQGKVAPAIVAAIIEKCWKTLQQPDKNLVKKVNSHQKNLPGTVQDVYRSKAYICVPGVLDNGEDISLQVKFSSPMALQECKLFSFYCELDSRVFPLTFLIVAWVNLNNLNNLLDKSAFAQPYPNRLIILLTIAFLQSKNVLPTVQKLVDSLPGDSKPVMAEGCNVSFNGDVEAAKKNHPSPLRALLDDDSVRAMSTLGLLKDWLQFYSEINLEEEAICPRFGYFVPKHHFQPNGIGNLPYDLRKVYSCQMDSSRKHLLSYPFCIQNPFDLTANCGLGMSLGDVQEFQNACKWGAAVVSPLLTSDQPDLSGFLSSEAFLLHRICGTSASQQWEAASHKSGPSECEQKVPSASPFKTAQANFDTVDRGNPELSVSGLKGEDQEKGDISDTESFADDAETRDCTLRINPTLYNFFARSFQAPNDVKYERMQMLVMQFILDFNQKFWTTFGLSFVPKSGQKYWPDDFAKISAVVEDGMIQPQGCMKTVMQKVTEVASGAKEIDVNFRVVSNTGRIHKLFLAPPENLTKKNWMSFGVVKELKNLMSNEGGAQKLDEIRRCHFPTSTIPSAEPIPIVSFECRLFGALSSSFQKVTPLTTLTIKSTQGDGESDLNVARINMLKTLYRKLGMAWIQKMVNRWLLECSDFNHVRASNFKSSLHQNWNAKRNKKEKQKQKFMQRQQGGMNAPSAPSHAAASTSATGSANTQIFPNHNQGYHGRGRGGGSGGRPAGRYF